MDTAQHHQYLTAFPAPSPSTIPRSHAHLTGASINSGSHWHQPSTGSSSSSGASSQMYPLANRSSDMVDYSSPSPSSHYGVDFNAGHQSPSIQTEHGFPLDLSAQVEGNIGPSRGSATRRRERMSQVSQHQSLRRRGNSEAELRSASSTFLSIPSSASRPQTPNIFPDHHFQPHTPLGMMQAQNIFRVSQNSLPQGHSFEQWNPTHNRSRSGSTSDLRSASPALSVASALTSMSSHHSAHNSHQFAPLSEPTSGLPDNPRQKGRKQRLFNKDRRRMCAMHLENPDMKQEALAVEFKVERSTVSKILKHKEKWLNSDEADDQRVAKHRPSKFPEIEVKLMDQLREESAKGKLLSDSLIRTKAKEIALESHIQEEKFKASSGWVDNFKSRWGIKRGHITLDAEDIGNHNMSPEPPHSTSDRDISRLSHYPQNGVENGIESEDSPQASLMPLQSQSHYYPHPTSTGNNSEPPPPPPIISQARVGPGIPTADAADAAIDTVIQFAFKQNESDFTQLQREVLVQVKKIILQTYINGIPMQPDQEY